MIQAIFENLCIQRFETDEYWTLPEDTRYALYREAEEFYREMLADRADYLRDVEKERPR